MRESILESRRLRHFLTVHELGSIGQAAERLSLTQPSLSKSIRSLEAALGVQLFERTPLGMAPTVHGEALAMHARAIAAQVRRAELQLVQLNDVGSGRISLGVGPSIAAQLMPEATARIRRRMPQVELSVTEGLVDDLIPALRRGEIDIAVGSWPRVADPAFLTEVLTTDRVTVCARPGHPLAARPVQLHELLVYDWVLPPATQRWRQELGEHLLAHGLSVPSAAVASNSASYLCALLKTGDYLSFLPHLLVSSQGLVPLMVDLPEMRADITATYHPRKMQEAPIALLADILREIGAELAG